mmetsp:Transcript_26845/g.61800  ORF Transcript_26845/g.61800 Transcript_26845/m.61800 type:complete len:396 (-) Transcript_26845:1219-2406(-)
MQTPQLQSLYCSGSRHRVRDMFAFHRNNARLSSAMIPPSLILVLLMLALALISMTSRRSFDAGLPVFGLTFVGAFDVSVPFVGRLPLHAYTRRRYSLHSRKMIMDTSSVAAGGSQRHISNIAVAGGGIGGLSFVRCVQKMHDGVSVSVFDPSLYAPDDDYGGEDGGGAGIQLNGGLAVLDRIDPSLRRQIARAGIPLERIRSRSCGEEEDEYPASFADWYRTLLEMDVRDCIGQTRGKAARSLIADDDGSLLNTAIHRGTLRRILYEKILQNFDDDGGGKKEKGYKSDIQWHWGSRVAGVVEAEREEDADDCGIYLEVEGKDGAVSKMGPYDAVVGADGIRSAVKTYVDKKDRLGKKNQSDAIYSGLRVQYALAPDTDDNYPDFLDYGADGTEYR